MVMCGIVRTCVPRFAETVMALRAKQSLVNSCSSRNDRGTNIWDNVVLEFALASLRAGKIAFEPKETVFLSLPNSGGHWGMKEWSPNPS